MHFFLLNSIKVCTSCFSVFSILQCKKKFNEKTGAWTQIPPNIFAPVTFCTNIWYPRRITWTLYEALIASDIELQNAIMIGKFKSWNIQHLNFFLRSMPSLSINFNLISLSKTIVFMKIVFLKLLTWFVSDIWLHHRNWWNWWHLIRRWMTTPGPGSPSSK